MFEQDVGDVVFSTLLPDHIMETDTVWLGNSSLT